jgi:hypothetical protein
VAGSISPAAFDKAATGTYTTKEKGKINQLTRLNAGATARSGSSSPVADVKAAEAAATQETLSASGPSNVGVS